MKRYYIVNSSVFHTAPYCQVDLIKAVIKELDSFSLISIKQVRKARYNGWSNQPQVVCFNAEEKDLNQIANRVKFVRKLPYQPIISEKHWR